MTGNCLIEYVAELSELPYLKKINLSSNKIETCWKLPIQIEYLIISHNSIKEIDDNILNLSELTSLNISNNFIKNIKNIGRLEKLHELNVDNNQIESFCGINQLTFLKNLSIRHNMLKDCKELSYLASLQLLSTVKLLGNTMLNDTKITSLLFVMLPLFRYDGSLGCLNKSKKHEDPIYMVDIEDEYFSDSTYKSLESTIKSNLGDLQENEETKFQNIVNVPDTGNKKVIIPKLKLSSKPENKVCNPQGNYSSTSDSNDIKLGEHPLSDTPFPAANSMQRVSIPKLNLNYNQIKFGSKISAKKIGDKLTMMNISGRACESYKQGKINSSKVQIFRERGDIKQSLTHSSQRSVIM